MTETVVAVIRAKLNLPDVSAFISAFAPLISPGGMFVRTRQLKDTGTVIRFDFSLNSGERLLLGEGVVRQVRDGSDGSPAGMLIKFTKLNRASKDLVDKIVAHKGSIDEPMDDGGDDLFEEDKAPAAPEEPDESEAHSELEEPPAADEPLQRSLQPSFSRSSSSGRILNTGDVLSALRDAPSHADVPTVGLPLNAPAAAHQLTGLGFLGLDEAEVDDVLGNLFGDSGDDGLGFGAEAVTPRHEPPSIAIVGASSPFASHQETFEADAAWPPSTQQPLDDSPSEDIFLADDSVDHAEAQEAINQDDPYLNAESVDPFEGDHVDPAPLEDDFDEDEPYDANNVEDDDPCASDPEALPLQDEDDEDALFDDEEDLQAGNPAGEVVEADGEEPELYPSDDGVVDADDDDLIALADDPSPRYDDEPFEGDVPFDEDEEEGEIKANREPSGFVLMDDDVSLDAGEEDGEVFSSSLEDALAGQRKAIGEASQDGVHPSRQTMQWQAGVIHGAAPIDEADDEDDEDYLPPQLSDDEAISDEDNVEENADDDAEDNVDDDGADLDLADEDEEEGEQDDPAGLKPAAENGAEGVFFFGEGGAPRPGEVPMGLEADPVDLQGDDEDSEDSEDGFDLDMDVVEAPVRESVESEAQQSNRVLGRIQLTRRAVPVQPEPLDDAPMIPDFDDDEDDDEDFAPAPPAGGILTLENARIESDSGRPARTGSESLDFFLDDDEDDAPRAPRSFMAPSPVTRHSSQDKIPSITDMSELGGLLNEIQGRADDSPSMSASELHLATGTDLADEMAAANEGGEDGEIPSLAGLVSAAHQEIDERVEEEVAGDSILDDVLGGDGPRIVPPNRNFDVPSPAESNLLAGKKKKGFFSRLFGSDD